MLIFKTYLKLVNRYKKNMLIYFVIFFAIAITMTKVLSNTGEKSFQAERLTVSVIDRDEKLIGNAIKKYFSNDVDFIEVEDDKKAILNELYWRTVDYVLVIPKGFEESLKGDNAMELESMKVPGNFTSTYFESELNLYTSKLMSLFHAGYSLETAKDMLINLNDEKAEVEMASFINAKQNDPSSVFFGYAPYLFITVGMIAIGLILICFNEEGVKHRTECGMLSLQERMAGMIGGIFVLGLILYFSVLLVGVIFSKGKLLTDNRLPYFMLNIFAILIFGLSLGFFAGMVAKTTESVNGMVNILSLGLCFGGGIFVPREFFSETAQKFCKIFPTYWYSVSNESIGAMKEVTSGFLKEIFSQTGLIFCYALVVFAITLLIVSGRRKQKA